jgi:hypothetical protein
VILHTLAAFAFSGAGLIGASAGFHIFSEVTIHLFFLKVLSPTIHKFGDEFTHPGLSAIRQAHRLELIEGLSEHSAASVLLLHFIVFANRSAKPEIPRFKHFIMQGPN